MASKWAIQTFSPISRSYPKFPLTAICSNYIDDEHKVSFQNNNFCYINVNYDPKFHVFIFIPLFVSKILAILSSYIQSLNDSRPFAHCPKFQHHSINHFTDSDLRLTRPSRPSERCLMNSNLLSLNHFLSRSFFPHDFFFHLHFPRRRRRRLRDQHWRTINALQNKPPTWMLKGCSVRARVFNVRLRRSRPTRSMVRGKLSWRRRLACTFSLYSARSSSRSCRSCSDWRSWCALKRVEVTPTEKVLDGSTIVCFCLLCIHIKNV